MWSLTVNRALQEWNHQCGLIPSNFFFNYWIPKWWDHFWTQGINPLCLFQIQSQMPGSLNGTSTPPQVLLRTNGSHRSASALPARSLTWQGGAPHSHWVGLNHWALWLTSLDVSWCQLMTADQDMSSWCNHDSWFIVWLSVAMPLPFKNMYITVLLKKQTMLAYIGLNSWSLMHLKVLETSRNQENKIKWLSAKICLCLFHECFLCAWNIQM